MAEGPCIPPEIGAGGMVRTYRPVLGRRFKREALARPFPPANTGVIVLWIVVLPPAFRAVVPGPPPFPDLRMRDSMQ